MSDVEPGPAAVATKLRKVSTLRPALAIVLGTGFDHLSKAMDVDAEVPYCELPGFSSPGVSGHAGKLLIGRLSGTPVIVLSGRAHFYEGHDMTRITFPIRALAAYPIADVLLTNAAGGLNRDFRAGDFMVLRDHINLMGANPLRGELPDGGLSRFVDLTCAYDEGLRRLLHRAGRASGLRIRAGVYLAVSGPSYETPAEIRAFARLGADAVGMSTVPEAIVARQCGLRVGGLSCITNLAAGRSGKLLSHMEVMDTASRVKGLATQILKNFAKLYSRAREASRPSANSH